MARQIGILLLQPTEKIYIYFFWKCYLAHFINIWPFKYILFWLKIFKRHTYIFLRCPSGFLGEHCEKKCPAGYFGHKCLRKCNCAHGTCNSATGVCECFAGFTGPSCDDECPPHTFGVDCKQKCTCSSLATCDPMDGSCLCPPGYTGEKFVILIL